MSLLAEWGAQLGEDFANYDSPEARSRRLSTLLHDKKALLIIDDVWDAEAARYFLVGGPRCCALITTRDNEVALNLEIRKIIGVETLTNAASLNLLRELAPKAVAADEKTATELANVLDGLPLALKLAGQMLVAKWEAGRGVATTLSQLKDREARLKLAGAEKRPGLETAKPSLRAILAMSYESLPDEATKRAFRLLGVFGGKPLTFSFEAATAVWGMELLAADDVITSLVGRALVEPVENGRYTLHTTLADFAESLLEEHGEAALARETHAKYYLEFARKNAEKNWRSVDVEMEQIQRGFDWASLMSKDKQMVLDYEQAMSIFFGRSGLWDDKMRWTQIGLEVARAKSERKLEAVLLNKIGNIYRDRNFLDEALDYFERSRTIQEEIGDQAGLAKSLNYIGATCNNKGLWNEALEYCKRSQAIQEEIGDQAGLALSINNIGYIYYNKGLWDDALAYYKRSLAINEDIGYRAELARTLSMIAFIYVQKGLWDDAMEYCKRSQAINEEFGNRAGLAVGLLQIGDIYEKQARHVEAEQVLTQAVAMLEALKSPYLDKARKQLDKVRELQQMASQK
jgi:tetratricopeptide (TPR) repeat protein